jgi:hypothetical protein
LSIAQTSAVVAEVDTLRRRLEMEPKPYGRESLRQLGDEILAAELLGREPAAHALAADLLDHPAHPTMSKTKAHINAQLDNTIFSVFQAAYFPSLSLDYLEYELIASDAALVARYPSPTMPVNILAHSTGFADRMVVALFPENHLDGNQTAEDLIFYFIDKFTARHNKLTKRLIEGAMVAGSFPALDRVDDGAIAMAAASWVRLHEYHHRTGSMPIPKYLKAKSYKPLAGLEEMRVDVKSMLVCLGDRELDRAQAELTCQFILAERLLRYSVEGVPTPNYDAIASQLLFNYLRSHGALTLCDDRLRLAENLPEVLALLIAEISEREDLVHQSVETARTALIEFTRQYTSYDAESRQFLHIPYFAELKARLAI